MSSSFQQHRAAGKRRDLWSSWMLFWHGLFYVSLSIATGLFLTLQSTSWQASAGVLGLSLLLGAWYGAGIFVFPPFWRQHALLTLGYLCIGWALWLALIQLGDVYLIVLSGLYPQAFVLLSAPWYLAGGGILLSLTLWHQFTEQKGWTLDAFFILLAGILGIIQALFIGTIVNQSRGRAQLIEELETTRQELARSERLAGTMQERQRLAREIHDTFTQGFMSIIMQVEAINGNDSAARGALAQVRRIAHENLVSTRHLLWALRPEIFEQTTLPDVLTSLVGRWSEESGVTARMVITGTSCVLYPEIEVTLLRTAQEALANVRKHAQAGSVVLTLSYLGELVLLDIQDDGQGFEPHLLPPVSPELATGGFGLKALRERVGHLEGTLTLESAPGDGTTLAVALPALSNAEWLAHCMPEIGGVREANSRADC